MSSPEVAGVLGLMMSARPRPTLGNSQIESLLYASSTDLGTAGRDSYYGHGRVNAAAAVLAALAALAATGADTQAPSVSIAVQGAGSTVSGLLSVAVSASDNVGVTRVDLRVNDSSLDTDASAP